MVYSHRSLILIAVLCSIFKTGVSDEIISSYGQDLITTKKKHGHKNHTEAEMTTLPFDLTSTTVPTVPIADESTTLEDALQNLNDKVHDLDDPTPIPSTPATSGVMGDIGTNLEGDLEYMKENEGDTTTEETSFPTVVGSIHATSTMYKVQDEIQNDSPTPSGTQIDDLSPTTDAAGYPELSPTTDTTGYPKLTPHPTAISYDFPVTDTTGYPVPTTDSAGDQKVTVLTPSTSPTTDTTAYPKLTPPPTVISYDFPVTQPTISTVTRSPTFITYMTPAPTGAKTSVMIPPEPTLSKVSDPTSPGSIPAKDDDKPDDDWFDDKTDRDIDDKSDTDDISPNKSSLTTANMTMPEKVIYEVEQNENLVIAAGASLLSLLLMVFTAFQVKENPNGLWAGCCRLLVLIFAFFCKIIFLPCYLICCRCGRQRERERSHAVPASEIYHGMAGDRDLELT